VTAVWGSPVFKQVAFQKTSHGPCVQNFLDIDSHVGSREDLRRMVEVAHEYGIHVALDVILNHAGNGFGHDSVTAHFQNCLSAGCSVGERSKPCRSEGLGLWLLCSF